MVLASVTVPRAAEAGGASKLLLKTDVTICNISKLDFLSGLRKPSDQVLSDSTGEG